MSFEGLKRQADSEGSVEGGLSQKRIIIDWDQAENVLDRLLLAYETGSYPYNLDSVRVPQDPRHLPETLALGGKEHAMFLWSSCYYMRGGIKSVDAFRTLSRVYDNHPDFFVASEAAAKDPREIAGLLKSYSLGFQHQQIGGFWVENAKRLHELWGGDPRNIFDGVDSYEESVVRIKNNTKGEGFLGFQEKMVSMITYYLMDDELIKPFVFPLPVDLHVMRVSVATEMLKFEGYDEDENLLSAEALAKARELYYQYALQKGVNPLRLCDAVWLLSQSLCGRQPGNITMEPHGRDNRNGRQTVLEPLTVDIHDPRQQMAYHKSCESCPINGSCEWNVPSKTYYVQGELKRRGRRIRFPASTLFTLSDIHPGNPIL